MDTIWFFPTIHHRLPAIVRSSAIPEALAVPCIAFLRNASDTRHGWRLGATPGRRWGVMALNISDFRGDGDEKLELMTDLLLFLMVKNCHH